MPLPTLDITRVQTQASCHAKQASAGLPLTLKQLSGRAPSTALNAQGTALLLIDFQREYEQDGRVPLQGLAAAAHEAQSLAQAADAFGLPVIHIHHVAAQANAALFDRDGPGVTPCSLPEIREGHAKLIKHWPSAFHDTPLRQELHRQDIHTVVLAGCMTHNCVDSTARHALHLGLQVIIAGDACATRALPTTDHTVIPADIVQRTALAALADRHATVMPGHEIRAQWALATTSSKPATRTQDI